MSRGTKTPSNQVRLTNVALVRYKAKGKKFELACYPNKVKDWRNGIEKNINEVVQTTTIFTNVSKGQVAAKNDLMTVFGVSDEHDVCLVILEKGELQVGQKERESDVSQKTKEIATIVADLCINAETQRPFPVTMIENSMKEAHFSVHPTHTTKSQALEVIKLLKEVLPIQRAQMRLRLEAPKKNGKEVQSKITALVGSVEDEDWGSNFIMTVVIDPGRYRGVTDALGAITKGQGSCEILDMKVQEEGDQMM